jgi:hypothetical protein
MNINFNLEGIGKDIAVLKNKNEKIKDKHIYMASSTEGVRFPIDVIEAQPDEMIQLAPSIKDERSLIYVVGASGSGKSFWTTQYVKEYLKKLKKNKVHLISPITDDKNINSLNPNRINPNTQAFLDDPPVCEDFKDSLLILDDVEAYDKKTLNRVMTLVNSIATVGRHANVSLMFLAHTACNGHMSKLLLSECHAIVLFPANMSGKTSKYLLDNYFGFNKSQIQSIKNVNSRAIVIVKSYPMIIVTERMVIPLNKFGIK